MSTGTVRAEGTDVRVIRATASDADAVTRVIERAFFDIAPCVWLFPDRAARSERLPALLRAQVEHALAHGIVYTTPDRDAAALWYIHRGGPYHADPQYAARLAAAVGPDHADRLRTFEACTDAVRPTDPHDYLFIAAVDPTKQRQGLGSQFLTGCHRELAPAGRPAYLEASDEDTRRLYLRLHYADAEGEGIVLPGPEATRLHPMLRRWIPLPGQRVTVRDEVDRWAGVSGRVTSLNPITCDPKARPVHVAIDGDEVRDFALKELRPERPHDPDQQ